jgi:serine/threonine-protein kinase RsbT
MHVLHEPEQPRRVSGFEVPIVDGNSGTDWRSHGHTDFVPAMRRIPIGSHADVVVARQEGRALAKTMQFSATDSAFIATTVSELARALLSRTVFGEICLQKVYDRERSGVVIVMRVPIPCDPAPDGRQAVASDLALPDVRRLVDEFDISPDGSDGTTIRATKWCRRR